MTTISYHSVFRHPTERTPNEPSWAICGPEWKADDADQIRSHVALSGREIMEKSQAFVYSISRLRRRAGTLSG